jgi:hypothetical protein
MPSKKRASAPEALIGIIAPIQWSDDGRITAVSLCATDDEQYLIENGEQFFSLAQKSIHAFGVVKREVPKSIVIEGFSILESYQP